MAKRETMVMNMGPQHPATHGVLRIELELDGETVVDARPLIGYLHTGIEKNMEAKTYTQALTMTDRMDYLAPMSNNLVYVGAIEKLMEVEVPPRAEYVRVIMTELTRVASHLVWLGTHAIDLGAMSMTVMASARSSLTASSSSRTVNLVFPVLTLPLISVLFPLRSLNEYISGSGRPLSRLRAPGQS